MVKSDGMSDGVTMVLWLRSQLLLWMQHALIPLSVVKFFKTSAFARQLKVAIEERANSV